MSNNDNKNSQQLFSEDITKRLVKKILEDKPNNSQTENNSDFNIENAKYSNTQLEDDFNDYDNKYYENNNDDYDDYETDDDDYYDDNDDYKPRKTKTHSNIKEQARRKTKIDNHKNHYRRNIERYGKDFFDDDYDDYDDYDDNSPSIIGKVISFSVIIVLTISTTFLAFSLVSTKKELEKSKAQIQELLDNKATTETKLMQESLKDEINTLKKENEDLKAQIDPNKINNTTDKTTQQTTKPSTTSNNSISNSNNSQASEYIVKEGDVIWNISKKVYGNGSHFQKILDANGLTEKSILKPGQKLIIPKLN